jgi:hypothetical protein
MLPGATQLGRTCIEWRYAVRQVLRQTTIGDRQRYDGPQQDGSPS